MHTLTPVARAAVAALDTFGANSRRDARTLLGYWRGRDQLTPVEVDQVLSRFPDGRGIQGDGLDYDRDDEEPTGQPVPAHVEGWHLGTRGGAR